MKVSDFKVGELVKHKTHPQIMVVVRTTDAYGNVLPQVECRWFLPNITEEQLNINAPDKVHHIGYFYPEEIEVVNQPQS